MLTGEFLPTEGEAYINGYPLLDQTNIRANLGYCPQFNAIFDLLTAREHLELYAALKGYDVDTPYTTNMINQMIRCLQLDKYADRLAGTYSGGNKRKLAVSLALIGNPSVVLLDEPSAGMDIGAARFMWEFISRTMDQRSVIL